MRASVIGLIALPIAASGVAAATVVGYGLSDPPTSPVGQTATAGMTGEATDEAPLVREGDGGTAIDGAKPYLTVIDGMDTVPVPAPIPSYLAQLTAPSVSLAPLPTPGGPAAPAGTAGTAGTGGARTGPAPSDVHAPHGAPTQPGSGRGDQPVVVDPRSDSGSDRDDRPGNDVPGGDPATPTPGVGRPPVQAPDSPGGGSTPGGPPPHAGETGRPPHAGETGRPPHAGETGRPPHAGGAGGSPDAGRGGLDTPAAAPVRGLPLTAVPVPGERATTPPDAGTPAETTETAVAGAPTTGDTAPAGTADARPAQR